MFHNARVKLTAWYLAIIMVISVFFSFAIYASINTELHRFERMQMRMQEDISQGKIIALPQGGGIIRIARPDPAFIDTARQRLLLSLAVINLAILGISGAAGYFLAGRTLQPIKDMVDEQHRFITDASHELRTPITALRTEIEVALREKTWTQDQSKKLLQSNLEEVVGLQTLSDNLLHLAQNGDQNDTVQIADISLAHVLTVAIKKIEPMAKRKGITIVHTPIDTHVLGIQDRLIELFVILLDNAIKYSPEKSMVDIHSKEGNKKIRIAVTDHGVGMSSSDQQHIFDRFYRADASRSRDGYGLGLSIAKKIVDAHHGTIAVTSSLDHGATFTIVLPLS